MLFGKDYAQIYDIVYKNKNYPKEVEALAKLFKRSGVKSILDIGCGTGGHAIPLTKAGYKVVGVDKSAAMIKIAKRKEPDLDFRVIDFLNFDTPEKFDSCIAIFNVIGYFDRQDLPHFFKQVKRHLKSGGLLILDYWDLDLVKGKLKKRIISIFRKKLSFFLKISRTRINEKGIEISYNFYFFPRLKHFEEIHNIKAFPFKILKKLAWKKNLKLQEVIQISDISFLLIFKKI